jgi:hypothetical protein
MSLSITDENKLLRLVIKRSIYHIDRELYGYFVPTLEYELEYSEDIDLASLYKSFIGESVVPDKKTLNFVTALDDVLLKSFKPFQDKIKEKDSFFTMRRRKILSQDEIYKELEKIYEMKNIPYEEINKETLIKIINRLAYCVSCSKNILYKYFSNFFIDEEMNQEFINMIMELIRDKEVLLEIYVIILKMRVYIINLGMQMASFDIQSDPLYIIYTQENNRYINDLRNKLIKVDPYYIKYFETNYDILNDKDLEEVPPTPSLEEELPLTPSLKRKEVPPTPSTAPSSPMSFDDEYKLDGGTALFFPKKVFKSFDKWNKEDNKDKYHHITQIRKYIQYLKNKVDLIYDITEEEKQEFKNQNYIKISKITKDKLFELLGKTKVSELLLNAYYGIKKLITEYKTCKQQFGDDMPKKKPFVLLGVFINRLKFKCYNLQLTKVFEYLQNKLTSENGKFIKDFEDFEIKLEESYKDEPSKDEPQIGYSDVLMTSVTENSKKKDKARICKMAKEQVLDKGTLGGYFGALIALSEYYKGSKINTDEIAINFENLQYELMNYIILEQEITDIQFQEIKDNVKKEDLKFNYICEIELQEEPKNVRRFTVLKEDIINYLENRKRPYMFETIWEIKSPLDNLTNEQIIECEADEIIVRRELYKFIYSNDQDFRNAQTQTDIFKFLPESFGYASLITLWFTALAGMDIWGGKSWASMFWQKEVKNDEDYNIYDKFLSDQLGSDLNPINVYIKLIFNYEKSAEVEIDQLYDKHKKNVIDDWKKKTSNNDDFENKYQQWEKDVKKCQSYAAWTLTSWIACGWSKPIQYSDLPKLSEADIGQNLTYPSAIIKSKEEWSKTLLNESNTLNKKALEIKNYESSVITISFVFALFLIKRFIRKIIRRRGEKKRKSKYQFIRGGGALNEIEWNDFVTGMVIICPILVRTDWSLFFDKESSYGIEPIKSIFSSNYAFLQSIVQNYLDKSLDSAPYIFPFFVVTGLIIDSSWALTRHHSLIKKKFLEGTATDEEIESLSSTMKSFEIMACQGTFASFLSKGLNFGYRIISQLNSNYKKKQVLRQLLVLTAGTTMTMITGYIGTYYCPPLLLLIPYINQNSKYLLDLIMANKEGTGITQETVIKTVNHFVDSTLDDVSQGISGLTEQKRLAAESIAKKKKDTERQKRLETQKETQEEQQKAEQERQKQEEEKQAEQEEQEKQKKETLIKTITIEMRSKNKVTILPSKFSEFSVQQLEELKLFLEKTDLKPIYSIITQISGKAEFKPFVENFLENNPNSYPDPEIRNDFFRQTLPYPYYLDFAQLQWSEDDKKIEFEMRSFVLTLDSEEDIEKLYNTSLRHLIYNLNSKYKCLKEDTIIKNKNDFKTLLKKYTTYNVLTVLYNKDLRELCSILDKVIKKLDGGSSESKYIKYKKKYLFLKINDYI